MTQSAFKKRLAAYREFVYEIGSLVSEKGKSIEPEVLERQKAKGFQITGMDCLKYKTRYFTDSAVIGSKKFVTQTYQQFSELFEHRREKKPVPIRGMDSVYSLRCDDRIAQRTAGGPERQLSLSQ